MDHSYGVQVTNKFSLFLDEDEDPLEALERAQAQANKKDQGDKKSSKSKQKKAPAPELKSKAPEQLKKDDKPVPRQNERGRGGRREPREIRDNDGDRRPRWQGQKENRDGGNVGDENVPPEFRERSDVGFRRRDGESGFGGERGRGRGRGRGGRGGERGFGGRGGRGNYMGGGDRRREFDRHSASDRTGVKPTDKRDGGGAHNWGTFKDDVEEHEQQNDSSADWTGQPETPAESTEAGETQEVEQGPKEDPEPQEMTLDEWKALQASKNKPKSEFNIRLAGEGVDGKQWQKGREYHKKHDDEEEEEEEDSEEEDEDDRHGRGKQLVTDIRITFNDQPRRGRGRRGGRGGMERGMGERGSRGGRGGFDRGERPSGPRGMGGGKPREAAPRFDDESDFPSLVKSAA